MYGHQLVEEYLSGWTFDGALHNVLHEASIRQIRKQQPYLEPVIVFLRTKKRVDNKYIPWVLKHLEQNRRHGKSYASLKKTGKDKRASDEDKQLAAEWYVEELKRGQLKTYLDQLIALSKKFEAASKAKKFDRAIKAGILKDQRVKDIMFWSKPKVKTKLTGNEDTINALERVLQRVEKLQARSDFGKLKSIDEIDIVYQDDRFFVARPIVHDSSCQLGKGTPWCIANPNMSYFNEYTGQGKAFTYIIDRYAEDEDYWKVAVEGEVGTTRFTYWTTSNRTFAGERVLADQYGADNWKKIFAKVKSYMSGLDRDDLSDEADQGPLITDGTTGEFKSDWIYNQAEYFTDSYREEDAFSLFWDKGLADAYEYATVEAKNVGDPIPLHAEWAYEEQVEVDVDFNNTWDYFWKGDPDKGLDDDEEPTVPQYPENPLKSAQQWFDFPEMKAQVLADYEEKLAEYDKAREYFEQWQEIKNLVDNGTTEHVYVMDIEWNL